MKLMVTQSLTHLERLLVVTKWAQDKMAVNPPTPPVTPNSALLKAPEHFPNAQYWKCRATQTNCRRQFQLMITTAQQSQQSCCALSNKIAVVQLLPLFQGGYYGSRMHFWAICTQTASKVQMPISNLIYFCSFILGMKLPKPSCN